MTTEKCTFCDGTGKLIPHCKKCDGFGWIDDPSDGGTMTCPECDNENCSSCNGEGEYEVIKPKRKK